MKLLNGFLLGLLAVSVVLNLAVRRDPTRPNREALPDMVRTAAYDSFAPNPNFADGKTLRTPVAGTIPRGQRPIHYQATPADALRAGEELQNPATPDAKARERGAFVFATFCQPCHGAAGKGDGPVTLRGVPPPPPLTGEKAVNMKDGQMFHILTYGQANMPSYASQISREDRWRVIHYVRSLQKPQPHLARVMP